MTVRRVLALLAWTVVVAVCSTAVWSVIRTAGTEVTTSPEVPSTVGTVVGTTRARTPPPSPPVPASASSRPRSRATTEPSSTPSATEAPTPEQEGDTEHRAGADATRPTRDPEPAEVRRTWQGTAGAVVASCRGAAITFRGAQPNSGWRVEVGDRGPSRLEVHFSRHGGGEEDDGELELEARCVGGAPRFSTSDS